MTEDYFDGRLNFGKAFPKLQSIDLRHNRIQNISVDRQAGVSAFSLAFSDILTLRGYADRFSKNILGSSLISKLNASAAENREVILLHGNPVTKAEFRFVPFDIADAWFTLLGMANVTTLSWLILDNVRISSIAPGAFRAMPNLEKVTFVDLDMGTHLIPGPFHPWGLPTGARVCALFERRQCEIRNNVETCCPATCSNCCSDDMDQIISLQ